MTNEEAIEELKILKEDYWVDDGYGHETKQYNDTMFALEMAIKTLELTQTGLLKDCESCRAELPCADAISRQAVIDATTKYCVLYDLRELLADIETLPSINVAEKTGLCKDCKHFVYDEFAIVNGIPIIVAHEICMRWSGECKTKEDGYCHMFEPKTQEVEE